MKCTNCWKKKEKLYCKACVTKSTPLEIGTFRAKIELLKKALEAKVSEALHFYFDSQERRERKLELRHLNHLLQQIKDYRSAQEEKIRTLLLKKQEKLAIAKKFLGSRAYLKQEIVKKNENLKKTQEKIHKLGVRINKMRVGKLKSFNMLLEMNTIYPHWTIYKELRIEKEGDFSPIEEEDISDTCIDSDNEEKFEKITFAKNFASLNEIYGGIMSFSLNQLAKIVYNFAQLYGILTPLVMVFKGDQVKIGNFLQNKEFFAVRNIAVRKNFTTSEKFLILLQMNMRFLIKSFGFEVEDQEFINIEGFSGQIFARSTAKQEKI